ncbi:hypothetical protein [Nocardia vinacea]|uniref:hypothetical protein n=1 Tax=Nocardia vinacea TaxID=96468 RepID=UPI003F4D81CA
MLPEILKLSCRELAASNADDYIRALMHWHFSEDTGSPFWLRRANTLDFDPLSDVRTFSDLSLFPNVVNEFREAPVEDMIPRGLTGADRVITGIYESGGTTGDPKRFVMFDRWMSWRNMFRHDIFPGIPLNGLYGNTTILGMSRERDACGTRPLARGAHAGIQGRGTTIHP